VPTASIDTKPYRKREKITSCNWGNILLAVYIFLRVQLSDTAYGGLVNGRPSVSTKPLTL
jgi:hypothetical protein